MPTKRKAAAKKGLTPKTFKGLNQKRMEAASRGQGKRVRFSDQEPTVTLQFLQDPTEFMEYNVHFFQEDGRWNVVPCAGSDQCPLCESESSDISDTSYRFAANVLNYKTGKVQVLEGPQALAMRVFSRFKRAKPKSKFLKRVYDVSKYPTKPVSYDMEVAEEDPVSTRGKKLYDLEEYLVEEMKAYYGDDLDITPGALSDDDDEDEEDEDDEDLDDEEEEDDEDDEDLDDEEDEDDDEEDDEEEDDEDDEDEDEDEDEDDEDEEEEDEDEPPAKPSRARKAPAKKAAAKKAPAKKAAATKKAGSRRR